MLKDGSEKSKHFVCKKIKGKLIVDWRAEGLFLNLESPWEGKILGGNSRV